MPFFFQLTPIMKVSHHQFHPQLNEWICQIGKVKLWYGVQTCFKLLRLRIVTMKLCSPIFLLIQSSIIHLDQEALWSFSFWTSCMLVLLGIKLCIHVGIQRSFGKQMVLFFAWGNACWVANSQVLARYHHDGTTCDASRRVDLQLPTPRRRTKSNLVLPETENTHVEVISCLIPLGKVTRIYQMTFPKNGILVLIQ